MIDIEEIQVWFQFQHVPMPFKIKQQSTGKHFEWQGTFSKHLIRYADDHLKMVIRRKDTNGLGNKVILAFHGQCASFTLFEMLRTHHNS
jgi:hypothetical protein